jgi:hypothetical protein
MYLGNEKRLRYNVGGEINVDPGHVGTSLENQKTGARQTYLLVIIGCEYCSKEPVLRLGRLPVSRHYDARWVDGW